MQISRTQFYWIIKAMCYILQSSAECPIPVNGLTCRIRNSGSSFINLYEGRRMACTSWVDKEGMKPYVIDLDLNPTGVPTFCDELLYILSKDKGLEISRNFLKPKISDDDQNPKPPAVNFFPVFNYHNEYSDIWGFKVKCIVEGTETHKDAVITFGIGSSGSPKRFEYLCKTRDLTMATFVLPDDTKITEDLRKFYKPSKLTSLWVLGVESWGRSIIQFKKQAGQLYVGVDTGKDLQPSTSGSST
ncbi:unnamed protein product [Albugo candida]|uniref:Uncharacterized protein n=1 Tax=Albugo candida TaxID=65357 RepID=A0A024FUU6_9STRA|nr:unnamed protein product [Albugo candida]|eukprot:CCI10414.1 unnamed protein product [Albugo candida]